MSLAPSSHLMSASAPSSLLMLPSGLLVTQTLPSDLQLTQASLPSLLGTPMSPLGSYRHLMSASASGSLQM